MFIRSHKNPIIPRKPGSFHSIHAANPDLLEFAGKIFMYFRGQGDEFHDQMGVASIEPDKFDGVNWNYYGKNPIIKVSESRADFNCRHILDPASVIVKDKVYLYYSGHSYDKPSGIGLAISENGFDCQNLESGPGISDAFAPEVVLKGGLVHLFYQKRKGNHFEFYKCTSDDGINFLENDEICIFGPSANDKAIDSFSITTCRILQEDGIYYMTYGGCRKFNDYPESFGIAKSTDLIEWKRFPGNPIFNRGNPGEWDEGAIWFPTLYNHNGKYYMWYEGSGAGLGTNTKAALNASDICRNNDYGGYAKVNFSQIGLAEYSGKLPNW